MNGIDKPAPRLPRADTRTALASFNWNISHRMVFETICGGATFVFVAFALSIGIRPESIGLVTTGVSLACLLQMLGLPFITRTLDKKRTVLTLSLLEPLAMMVAVTAIPFLPPGGRLPGLVCAAFIAAASLHLGKPMVDDWIGAVLPAGLRGRYFGRRVQMMTVTGMIATPLVGLLAGLLDDSDTFGFALFLVAGGGFGLLAALALRRASMPDPSAVTVVRLADFVAILRVKRFRRYLLGVAIFTLPFYFIVPYYHVYHLTVLNMSKFAIGCIMPLYGILKVASAAVWAKSIRRLGMRRILLATSPTYVTLFAVYALIDRQQTWAVFAGWALCGVADAAWGVCVQTALYSTVPKAGSRTPFFAVFNLVSLGLYGVAAAIAVPVLNFLRDRTITLGPFVLDQFRIFFGAASLLMVFASLGVLLFPSRRETFARDGAEAG